MNRDHFRLSDRQFAKLKPHLPTDTRGKPRVDDRRVISSIIHVIKSGGRWVDAGIVMAEVRDGLELGYQLAGQQYQ